MAGRSVIVRRAQHDDPLPVAPTTLPTRRLRRRLQRAARRAARCVISPTPLRRFTQPRATPRRAPRR